MVGTHEPGPVGTLADRLPDVLGPFQRSIRRSVRSSFRHRFLPEAQADLLRAVEVRPGVKVSEAATALGVAPNTVSTLLRELVHQGLLERRPVPGDRRSVELHLAPHAVELLTEWEQHRTEVIRDVLGTLSPADLAALEAALPALERLRAALDARASD